MLMLFSHLSLIFLTCHFSSFPIQNSVRITCFAHPKYIPILPLDGQHVLQHLLCIRDARIYTGNLVFSVTWYNIKPSLCQTNHSMITIIYNLLCLPSIICILMKGVIYPGAAFEGGKWGDCPRPRSWGGPALQAYEFVKLYSPVNWKCWYMLRLKSFFKVKFRSVVLGCLLYRNRHNQCLR